MRKTAIFKHPLFLEHDPGFNHPESPERLRGLYDYLDGQENGGPFLYPDFAAATPKTIELIHTPEHVARVAATAGRTYDALDPDTHTSPRSYDAACRAVGAVVEATRLVVEGGIDNGFALVRPPGHHAERHESRGFCLFNNIAIAAQYGLSELGLERILIVDWDLHHGNGTQHAFYDTDQVLYFSTHQYPYYPGTGDSSEAGRGKGEGYTINVPLRGGQGDADYLTILRELLVPVARQYRPQLIMVSAGYDIYHGDPLGLMTVSGAGFGEMTRCLVELAAELCQGRLLLTLEGGYNLQGLKEGVATTLAELAGLNEERHRSASSRRQEPCTASLAIEEARSVAKKYWTL